MEKDEDSEVTKLVAESKTNPVVSHTVTTYPVVAPLHMTTGEGGVTFA